MKKGDYIKIFIRQHVTTNDRQEKEYIENNESNDVCKVIHISHNTSI